MARFALLWAPSAWDAYLYWQGQDRKAAKRINELIRAIEQEPFKGIGKPEPLMYNFAGWWSRRIDDSNA
jgi:toxin YoeB